MSDKIILYNMDIFAEGVNRQHISQCTETISQMIHSIIETYSTTGKLTNTILVDIANDLIQRYDDNYFRENIECTNNFYNNDGSYFDINTREPLIYKALSSDANVSTGTGGNIYYHRNDVSVCFHPIKIISKHPALYATKYNDRIVAHMSAAYDENNIMCISDSDMCIKNIDTFIALIELGMSDNMKYNFSCRYGTELIKKLKQKNINPALYFYGEPMDVKITEIIRSRAFHNNVLCFGFYDDTNQFLMYSIDIYFIKIKQKQYNDIVYPVKYYTDTYIVTQ